MMKYDSYRDSEIHWLGNIPTHWIDSHLKRVCRLIKDGTHGSFQRVDSGYPLLSVRNIVDNKFVNLKDDSMISKEDYLSIVRSFKVKEGDIQLAIVGATMGKVALVPKLKPFATQRSIATIRVNERVLLNKYLFYFIQGNRFQKNLWSNTNYSAQPGIYLGTIEAISVPIPPPAEQETIADYLDTKTQAIDKKVELLEKKITYYQELRKSLINETVTKGLNKDVKLKDSGIDWIGQIPEHWEFRRIKDYTYVKARIGWQGLRSDEFELSGDYYCVTGTDFLNGKIDWSNCYHVEKERFDQDKKIIIKEGDLLITKDGSIGKTAIVQNLPKPATLNSGVFVTRPRHEKYINEYMYWLLNSRVFFDFVDFNKNGTTILHLYQNVFEKFFYCLPPKNEQKDIANYLEKKTSEIDQIVKNIQTQIITLKELRKTLINDVVTGKIKVSESGSVGLKDGQDSIHPENQIHPIKS
ncbi:restriction endonuclease subunit S [Reichenbachiella versicolor]|uniref:restriction endonuclease subunit S n=1 Tax=Reichenbachiella versicolor TaxID=1821036 RepID=UPI000D6E2D5F|nr:restriction endonuclease subunit S [Reichenbachiella versicolor]